MPVIKITKTPFTSTSPSQYNIHHTCPTLSDMSGHGICPHYTSICNCYSCWPHAAQCPDTYHHAASVEELLSEGFTFDFLEEYDTIPEQVSPHVPTMDSSIEDSIGLAFIHHSNRQNNSPTTPPLSPIHDNNKSINSPTTSKTFSHTFRTITRYKKLQNP
jgi:hypothetical protein